MMQPEFSATRPLAPLFRITSFFVAIVASVFAYPTIFQTGLTIGKPNVQPGYVIFGASDGNAYAIDVNGQVAKKWTSQVPGTDFDYVRPLANRNLLARLRVKRTGTSPQFDSTGSPPDAIVELNQDGREVWRYQPELGRFLHHDFERIENGNTLVVCARDLERPAISTKLLTDDCLVEVDPSGKVVWEWQTSDHLADLDLPAQARADIMAGYGSPNRPGAPGGSKGMDYLHMNAASPIPASAGLADPRFRAGNIIVSYRYLNTVAVVDRSTKKIVWKMSGTTVGQHNPYFIPAGVPGTGHILIFDNGNVDIESNPMHANSRPNSRVIEVNPLDNSIVWEYSATNSNRPIWTFFSHFISSAQRQLNGNTLICEGANGRIFEVRSDGEIVWEYVNPFQNTSGRIPNSQIFRAAKVAQNWLKTGS
jgi:hypothetical protein